MAPGRKVVAEASLRLHSENSQQTCLIRSCSRPAMKPSVPSIAIGLICLACSVIARADADFDFDLMHALDDALVREHVHTAAEIQ